MVVIRSGITRSGWCAVTRGAGAAVAGVSGGDVCLVFAEPDGSRCREPLERCWNVRFEDVPPVRSFPSRQGQRHSRVCGGLRQLVIMSGMSRGWNDLLTELTEARGFPLIRRVVAEGNGRLCSFRLWPVPAWSGLC